jgi:hypothetical protein
MLDYSHDRRIGLWTRVASQGPKNNGPKLVEVEKNAKYSMKETSDSLPASTLLRTFPCWI